MDQGDRGQELRDWVLEGLIEGKGLEALFHSVAKRGESVSRFCEELDLDKLLRDLQAYMKVKHQLRTLEAADHMNRATERLGEAIEVLPPSPDLNRACSLMFKINAPYRRREQGVAVQRAVSFLRATLRRGPIPAKDVIALAAGCGISRRTLQRAKPGAGVVSRRVGFRDNARFVWQLVEVNEGNVAPSIAT